MVEISQHFVAFSEYMNFNWEFRMGVPFRKGKKKKKYEMDSNINYLPTIIALMQ